MPEICPDGLQPSQEFGPTASAVAQAVNAAMFHMDVASPTVAIGNS